MNAGGRGEKRRARRHHRDSTDVRSAKTARVVLVVTVAAALVGPLTLATGNTSALGNPGFVGFITNDGLFFVQYGYSQFGYVSYVHNGSDIYASALVVNITAVTLHNNTAHVRLYDYGAKTYIYNATVSVPGYGTEVVSAPLPVIHSYGEFRLEVDGTPGYFYAEAPYNFLTFTALTDGGSDLAVFIAFGVFLAYALPMMVKGENMTRRAIYAHRSQAIMWLHGIFFGLVGWYFVGFPTINSFFKGWEFIAIPFPEALFLFFWSAGRHSQNNKAMFIQIIASDPGERLSIDYREFYVGKAPGGGLAIIRPGRGPIQWLYRAWGHHVIVYRRGEGKPAPMPLSSVVPDDSQQASLADDPMQFPRGNKIDPHDDFPVPDVPAHIWSGQSDTFRRFYYVKRASDLDKIEWPRMVMHRDKWVEEYTTTRIDPVTRQAQVAVVQGHYEPKLCWPFVKDGARPNVELWGWHKMASLAQYNNFLSTDDLTDYAESLALQLATERGKRYTLAKAMANEQTLGEDYVRSLATRNLSEFDRQQYVPPARARHDPRALPPATDA